MNNNNEQNKNRKDELGALWKKKSKTGMPFLSGYVKVDDLGIEKEIKVVVFANNNKNNDKAPDYRIYISKPINAESEKTVKNDSSSQANAASKKNNQKVEVASSENEEDIL